MLNLIDEEYFYFVAGKYIKNRKDFLEIKDNYKNDIKDFQEQLNELNKIKNSSKKLKEYNKITTKIKEKKEVLTFFNDYCKTIEIILKFKNKEI